MLSDASMLLIFGDQLTVAEFAAAVAAIKKDPQGTPPDVIEQLEAQLKNRQDAAKPL